MARNGELSGGLVSESAALLARGRGQSGRGRRDPAPARGPRRATRSKRAKTTYDKGSPRARRGSPTRRTRSSRDPKQAVEDLFYAKSKIETKVAIEVRQGDGRRQGPEVVPLLRRARQVAGEVDEAIEYFDDQRRLAKMYDDARPAR